MHSLKWHTSDFYTSIWLQTGIQSPELKTRKSSQLSYLHLTSYIKKSKFIFWFYLYLWLQVYFQLHICLMSANVTKKYGLISKCTVDWNREMTGSNSTAPAGQCSLVIYSRPRQFQNRNNSLKFLQLPGIQYCVHHNYFKTLL